MNNNESGGAGRAALRLQRGLKEIGLESSILVRKKDERSSSDSVIRFHPDQSTLSQTFRALRYAWMRRDFFPRYVSWPIGGMPLSDDRSRFAGEVVSQLPPSDLLHFHWVAEFIDIPSSLQKINVPIVWTLHDMNPLTGGCHYTSGCRKFEQSCGCCPQIDSSRENDPSRRSWKRKRSAFKTKISSSRLHFVAPSEWIAREAERSTLVGDAPIHHIPHGIDHTLFKPTRSGQERSRLGISTDQRIVLFIAHLNTDPRKGFDLLADALSDARLARTTLMSIGSDEPTVSRGLSHVHVGHVDDDQRLARLYSMSDLFVIPSLQEVFGLTALEAMACGTPVVGFDAGGIPDMVRPGETGWLAKTGDVRELRRAIEAALESDEQRWQMAARCREVVEEEYTLKQQAEKYVNLYESILSEPSRD